MDCSNQYEIELNLGGVHHFGRELTVQANSGMKTVSISRGNRYGINETELIDTFNDRVSKTIS